MKNRHRHFLQILKPMVIVALVSLVGFGCATSGGSPSTQTNKAQNNGPTVSGYIDMGAQKTIR